MPTYALVTSSSKRQLILRTVIGKRLTQKRWLIIRSVKLARLKSSEYAPPPPTKGQIFPRGQS